MTKKQARNIYIHLHNLQSPERIERVAMPDGRVRWKGLMLLAPGIWTDANTKKPFHYSAQGIKNSAHRWSTKKVNFFHEREDATWEVGEVDTQSATTDDEGRLFADIVLSMQSNASKLADEALQASFRSGGSKGIQGPSVELMGEQYRYDEELGMEELVRGTFGGVALVGVGLSPGPASETASFAHQVQERLVAMQGVAQDSRGGIMTFKSKEPRQEQIVDVDKIVALLQKKADDEESKEALKQLAAAAKNDSPDSGDEPESDPGKIVKALMDGGLSVEQIAEKSGVEKTIVEGIQSGKTEASKEVAAALAKLQDDDDDDEGEDAPDDDADDDPEEEPESGPSLADAMNRLDEMFKTVKGLMEKVAKLDDSPAKLQAIDKRLQKIESAPRPPKTRAGATTDDEPAEDPIGSYADLRLQSRASETLPVFPRRN